MAETRHRTVIEIGVDDREIRGLGQVLGRAFDDRQLASFERTLDRTTRVFDRMHKIAERYEQTTRRTPGLTGTGARGGAVAGGAMPGGLPAGSVGALTTAITQLTRTIRQMGVGGGGGAGGAGGGGGGGAQGGPAASRQFGRRTMATALGTYLGNLGRAAPAGGGFVGSALGGIPIVGGMLGGGVQAIQNYFQQGVGAQTAAAQQMGTLGARMRVGPEGGVGGIPGAGQFQRFGMAFPQAVSQAANISQQAGLTGRQMGGGFTRAAMELQMFGGIQGGPGMVRAANVGRQGMGADLGALNNADVMFQAVTAGMVSGIRESRLGQFVQQATQVLEEGRLAGTGLTEAGVLQIQQGFSQLGAGFEGERAQRVMPRVVAHMRTFQPGQDFGTALMMSAGRMGQPGGMTFHDILESMQEDPERMLPLLIQQMNRASGGDPRVAREMWRTQGASILGFQPSMKQARSLGAGDISGFRQTVDTAPGRGFIQRRAQELGGAFGAPAEAAGMQNRRIAIGLERSIRDAAVAIENLENSLARELLPRLATGIEDLAGFMRGSVGAFEEGGLPAMIQHTIRSMQEEVIPAVREAVIDSFEALTEAGFRAFETPAGGRLEGGGVRAGERGVRPPPAGGEAAGEPGASAADVLDEIAERAALAARILREIGAPGEGAVGVG